LIVRYQTERCVVEKRFRYRVAKSTWVTAVLLLSVSAGVAVAVALTMRATGASLGTACLGVAPGVGWGGLSFACGWWLASRRHESVGAEVAKVIFPLLKELKHLRAQLAQRVEVDDFARTSLHPRRVAPPSDEAKTTVASYDRAREAVR
jgi:hypothetical protein